MSHIDTWDPKPEAGYDYMGELPNAIPTNVDGIRLGQLFPALAKQADKFSLIRSMTHHNNGHETAAYLMQTAHTPGESLSYPSIGAVFALLRAREYKGVIPPYVVLTQPQGRFSEEGFLGPQYKPFATGGDPNAARFEVEGMVGKGITEERQRARGSLREKLNTMGVSLEGCPEMVLSARARKEAFEMIEGGREVFDLDKEKPELRARYGRHTFGQDCLAARRMVEALHRHQLLGRVGHSCLAFRHHARAVSAARPGPRLAALGSQGTRPARLHDGLVLRRVRAQPAHRLAGAVERRPQPPRQCVHRLGRRWRVPGRAGGRGFGCQGGGGP
jgi:hypothetical protein